MPDSQGKAFQLLVSLGASRRLLVHARLVADAAGELLAWMDAHGVPVRTSMVRAGAVLHDAGKIAHPAELDEAGSAHEDAGEKLLLAAGVVPELARFCLSHARYQTMQVSFEELLVALSDKLWKGKRAADLELRVIDEAARALGKDRWDLFPELDACFEQVAAKGDERLALSRIL